MNQTTFVAQEKAVSMLQSRIAEDVGEWVHCPICKRKTHTKIRVPIRPCVPD